MSNSTTIKFIGRKNELQKLQALFSDRRAALVVVNGRRRIGKSRLVAEFAKGKRFLSISGLAPSQGTTAQMQRDHFGRHLAKLLGVPPMSFADWSDAFDYLFHCIDDDKETVILLDEISWMGSCDPTFIPKLKNWWDDQVSHRPKTMLVFCGSVSTWIEKNIINSTAFFGRISFHLTLEPLTLPESAAFLKSIGFKGSNFEMYQILSILGGIPWYLEQIKPDDTVEQNIKRLCFEKGGMLVNEFKAIFHDLFDKEKGLQKNILDTLKDGAKTLAQVHKDLGKKPSGVWGKYMHQLITCGFVSQHPQWSLKTHLPLKQSLYRISDPFIRFYLKFIEPELGRISNNYFSELQPSEIFGFGF